MTSKLKDKSNENECNKPKSQLRSRRESRKLSFSQRNMQKVFSQEASPEEKYLT